ncbi:allantoinase [Bacillus massiliglaciei]|uniref:allantoinase n=1 Tax=Bacillus massiliglaciei TaxID=1816693 RepID=UPI000A567851|nr:allantoinase [Bacillus massiliglaciei]
MQEYDLLIRDGQAVLPSGIERTDIAVKDGVIVEMGQKLTGRAKEELEAAGDYIFPGMIDVHVHFSEPGREHWEGFETGSQMMAAGGCTTYFDMPLNGIPSTVTLEALKEKAGIGEQKSLIDFGLWGGLVPGHIEDLPAMAEAGVVGFKAFMSATGNEEFERADDKTLLEGMKVIASLGKILALHAESEPITSFLLNERIKEGTGSADDYAASRPVEAESEAVERALYYAKLTGCPLHFVHISSSLALEKIETAKKAGVDVTVETCPHYLLFNQETLREKGAAAKCAPPLREKQEQDRLIQLLKAGKFDMISSDHSPCPYHLKDPAVHGLFEAWGGISGGQFSLLSMIELALEHELPFTAIAEWTAGGPAERFRLPGRGEIKVGHAADFAIVTLNKRHIVTEENFFAKHKQSVYIGHEFPCSIEAVMNRGSLIYRQGKFLNDNVKGGWLTPEKAEEKIVG